MGSQVCLHQAKRLATDTQGHITIEIYRLYKKNKGAYEHGTEHKTRSAQNTDVQPGRKKV